MFKYVNLPRLVIVVTLFIYIPIHTYPSDSKHVLQHKLA